jgi:hypothetical protein
VRLRLDGFIINNRQAPPFARLEAQEDREAQYDDEADEEAPDRQWRQLENPNKHYHGGCHDPVDYDGYKHDGARIARAPQSAIMMSA